MRAWLILVLLSLATFRATRLVVRDDFPPIKWARDRITRPEWLHDLVTCHWCASAYLSGAGVLGLMFLPGGCPLPVLMWFATWGVGASLVHLMDRV